MLVLSRKQNERIRVGDSVVVTIVRVSGDKVRIGIEAPADVRVLRDELEPCDALGGRAIEATTVGGNHPLEGVTLTDSGERPHGGLRLAAAG